MEIHYWSGSGAALSCSVLWVCLGFPLCFGTGTVCIGCGAWAIGRTCICALALCMASGVWTLLRFCLGSVINVGAHGIMLELGTMADFGSAPGTAVEGLWPFCDLGWGSSSRKDGQHGVIAITRT